MALLKNLGVLAGKVTGGVVGGSIGLTGKIVKSDFIQDVGKGVYRATSNTGEVLGSLADGTYQTLGGVVTGSKERADRGRKEVVDTVGGTLTGMGIGVLQIAGKGRDTVRAIAGGDKDTAITLGKDLAKIAAVGLLSFGVFDLFDGAEGAEHAADTGDAGNTGAGAGGTAAAGTGVLAATDAANADAADGRAPASGPAAHAQSGHDSSYWKKLVPDGPQDESGGQSERKK
ncbi:hypothetical protein QWJ34_22785 [Saccharibacillus sp. CPCC 101409]|uniref:hypothetical protein n=1 Tax=Saccharibacillus sp. CPCC 101409 TaxID=3058041 RepID=UPI002673BE37|nr:hypothetical protein [Saccharibacillus sp. CPCC 101409]MDO3412610.1 hypothetical protein [Saccharibacillus sp. CPCC 101409]